MFTHLPLQTLIFVAGIGQIALILASLAIPRVLHWREQTAKLRPLTRQVFWTWAAYIWSTNFCFGLVSLCAPDWLLDRSPLAATVSAFIAVCWGARLVIQFAYFDRKDAPPGVIFRVAEVVLVGLFLFLTSVYACAAVANLGEI